MKIEEALAIVLDLAKKNVILDDGDPQERIEAIKVVSDHLTNLLR